MVLSRLVLTTSIVTLLAAPHLKAADYVWSTGGTTDVWSNDAADTNWNSPLVRWTDSNNAIFDEVVGERVTISGSVMPTTTIVGENDGSWQFVGDGSIGGDLIKEGSGTLSFGTAPGENAYTGVNLFTSTTINGGTISIGGGGTGDPTSTVNALGVGDVTINSGGTLKLWIKNNNAATAPWTFANNLIVNGGTVLGEDGVNAIAGTVTVGAQGATFSAKWNTKNLLFNGVISGSGPVTVKRAVGGSGEANATVIMTAKNTYTGGTTIESGILQLGTDIAANANSVGILVGDVTVGAAGTLRLMSINALGYGAGQKVNTLNINGGTVIHEGNGDSGWGVTYNMTGGTMRSTSATGQFAFGGGTTVNTLASASSATIGGRIMLREDNANDAVVFNTAQGDAFYDLVIDAAIAGNSNTRTFQKEGAGTLLLNGLNTYAGPTLVNNGTLVLGARGELAASPITIGQNATFQVAAGGKSFTQLTANDGARLALAASSTAPTFTTSLTLPATGTVTVLPTFTSRPLANQTFDLLQATVINGAATLVPAFDLYGPSRVTGTTSIVESGGTQNVRLTITQGGADLVWNNAAGNGTWDLNTSANFANGGSNDVFKSLDAVTFDGSTGAAGTVTLVGNLAPSLVTVNNDFEDGDYIFEGGSLIGGGSLVKSGTGYLTFSTGLNYGMTGGVTMNDGLLNLGGRTISISAPLVVNNGTLNGGTVNAAAFDLKEGRVETILAGAGALTKTGTETVIISQNNTYTGGTVVNAGTLQVGDKGSTGVAGTGSITINQGGTVRFDRNNNYGNVTNNFIGNGALEFDGVMDLTATQYFLTGDNSNFSGTITALMGRVGANNSGGNRFGTATLTNVDSGSTGGQFWLTGGDFANNFTISGLGWDEATGRFGAIRFGGGSVSGNITLAGDTRIGAHDSTGAISGVISGPHSLEFGGSSLLSRITLSGANTYTGITMLNHAAVTLTGSLASSSVIVSDDSTIGGNGTIAGGLTLGTLTGGASLAVNGGLDGALDVDGALTTVGSTPVGVVLTPGSNMPLGSPYTFLTFGSTTATAANFVLSNPNDFRQGVITVSGNEAKIDIGSKAVTWTGTGGMNWDINTTQSWQDGAAVAEKYFQGDAVTFGNAGGGEITLATGLVPSKVTVNSSSDFTFVGGTITSSQPLVKDGTGTLLLNNQNTITGGFIIDGGTLAVDGNQQANRIQNNAPIVINDGGTFEVRGVNALPNHERGTDVTVNTGGTFRVVSGSSAAAGTSHAHFRTVTMNGGTLDLHYSGSGAAYNNESFQLGPNGFVVGGDSPSTVITTGDETGTYTGIALAGSRTFLVNDVTGSPAADFIVAAELENSDSGTGTLNKVGAGTMQIDLASSYTGTTEVAEGTLLVSAALAGTTNVNVAAGARLGGSGTIRPGGAGAINVQAGGIIAPGIGLGTLTVDAGGSTAATILSLTSGAKFEFDLGTGLQSDRIVLAGGGTGDFTFTGNTINFSDLSAGTLTGGAYTLFSADITDAFGGLTVDGNGFISAGLTIGTGLENYGGGTLQLVGNDIVLNVVPEPASVASLAGGVAMLLGFRRRRRS